MAGVFIKNPIDQSSSLLIRPNKLLEKDTNSPSAVDPVNFNALLSCKPVCFSAKIFVSPGGSLHLTKPPSPRFCESNCSN